MPAWFICNWRFHFIRRVLNTEKLGFMCELESEFCSWISLIRIGISFMLDVKFEEFNLQALLN